MFLHIDGCTHTYTILISLGTEHSNDESASESVAEHLKFRRAEISVEVQRVKFPKNLNTTSLVSASSRKLP